jgi:hypothetical protein
MSNFFWLLFLDKNSPLEEFFTDINIPFNCEFLVVQPEDDHVVGLTEVYRVSPTLPLQTYRFGNWTPVGGLTWPSKGFYHRRNSLQGLTLKTGYKHVCTRQILCIRKLLNVSHKARFLINFS